MITAAPTWGGFSFSHQQISHTRHYKLERLLFP